jgi:hypothetical protein
MEKRYSALRTIGTIYKVLGIVAGAITVLVVVALCLISVLGGAALGNISSNLGGASSSGGLFPGVLAGLIGSFMVVLWGGSLSVTLYALGEGVYLLIALEENTRNTALALQALARGPAEGKP